MSINRNTNPTALSLATILASAQRMAETISWCCDAELGIEDLATVTASVEDLARRNGNSAAVLHAMADTIKNGQQI
jgi:hypothetical protein